VGEGRKALALALAGGSNFRSSLRKARKLGQVWDKAWSASLAFLTGWDRKGWTGGQEGW
jgi:hypothetical protein